MNAVKHLMAVREIPEHLLLYTVQQDASLYTPIDHASWRFILKISRAFFASHAHQKYLDGLRETGISLERIPLIQEMDACLSRFGWRAVAVSGFIPPMAFMEFLSLGILPIACDMRSLEHLAYTPAPDIVHEAAGHAPIIADPEYQAYLRAYGEISRKAISSDQDHAVYLAIRDLSVVKENPASTPADIAAAQKSLDKALSGVTYLSESAEIARMNWWTIEYGLVGDLANPKIYGAGLLSSVGESYHCLGPSVKKVPLTVDCIRQSYDITRPQPQLFVTPSFHELTVILNELAETMAFRRGGSEGLGKAQRAHTTATAVLDSGLEISGTLAGFEQAGEAPAYLMYQGPTQLSFAGEELPGQGASYHAQGFGSPVGRIRRANGTLQNPAELTDAELEALGFAPGRKGKLEFESGVTVVGVLTSRVSREGSNLILVFEGATVTLGARKLFEPTWGTFDMACGSRVVSVYGGAADRARYLADTVGMKSEEVRQKTNLTPANRGLNQLYGRIRKVREGGNLAGAGSELESVRAELDRAFPEDWLARFELVELLPPSPARTSLCAQLQSHATRHPAHAELIARGLSSLEQEAARA